jgi:hypothetical protein
VERWSRPVPLLLITAALRASALVLPQFFSGDEAIYSALAVRLLSGYDMYAGAVDHKPAGVTLLYAAIFAVVGRNHIAAIRIVLIVAVWATGVALAHAAVLLQGDRRAAVAGLIYVCASSAGQPRDALSANTELFLNLPLAATAAIVATAVCRQAADRGRARERAARMRELAAAFAAGALTGIAGLFKYQAALAGIAWAITFARAYRRPARWIPTLSALAAGFLVVVAALCAFFYLRGEWEPFVFWGWSYNFRYISALSTGEKLRSFATSTAWVSLFWSAFIALALVAVRARRIDLLTAAWFAAACVSVSIGGRFFRFYYLMALPPLSLAAAAGARRLVEARSWWQRPILAAAVVSVAIAATLPLVWRSIQPNFEREHETLAAVGGYIKEHSAPDERVFVWGNSSQIYYFADRVMATRFAFCNYQIGKIWGSWSWAVDAGDTSMFIVPRAWTELLEDLDAAPPAIIVDAAAGRLANFDRHPISRYPALASRLEARYHFEATVRGVPIYRRTAP